MNARATLLLGGLMTAAVGPVAAQAGTGDVRAGIEAYRALELGRAVHLLRRGASDTTLPWSLRGSALMYLGAAEHLRGQQGEAVDAFGQLVLALPGFRPDERQFPDRVRRAFDQVRATVKAAALDLPSRSTFAAGSTGLPIDVTVSSGHLLRLSLRAEAGGEIRRLFDGEVADALTTHWDGLTADGVPPAAGRYVLEAVSLVTARMPLRAVRVPLTVRVTRGTAPRPVPAPPPDSLFRREYTGAGAALRLLGAGTLLGALLIEPAATGDVSGEGIRIGLGTLAVGAGLIGAIIHRPGRPIPGAIAHNDRLRLAWARDVERARAENARRAGITRISVTTGEATRVEIGR